MKKLRPILYRSVFVIAALSVIGWVNSADESLSDQNGGMLMQQRLT